MSSKPGKGKGDMSKEEVIQLHNRSYDIELRRLKIVKAKSFKKFVPSIADELTKSGWRLEKEMRLERAKCFGN